MKRTALIFSMYLPLALVAVGQTPGNAAGQGSSSKTTDTTGAQMRQATPPDASANKSTPKPKRRKSAKGSSSRTPDAPPPRNPLSPTDPLDPRSQLPGQPGRPGQPPPIVQPDPTKPTTP